MKNKTQEQTRKHPVPEYVEIRGARANNLKNIDVDIPLNQYVALCGVSGSGKSTLATDVLYAEGSRRYLQALSTYTRRRIGQTARPDVESIHYLPSAIALRQRPTVPGVRSTVGTMSEVLNILRLSFSRLGSHVCPAGHRLQPSLEVAQTGRMVCPVCGISFMPPSAEDFAFNSRGACPDCHGTGEKETVNEAALIGDVSKTISQGAVLGWKVPGSFFYVPAAQALGIPIDIPYKELSQEQKRFILRGVCQERVPVHVSDSKGKWYDMTAQYLNAADAVAHAYNKTDSEKIRSRLAAQFYHVEPCPACRGSRFAPHLLQSSLAGKNIAQVCGLSLLELEKYAGGVPDTLPDRVRPMGKKLMDELLEGIHPLLELGLSYLSLDRAGGTLSTGELQRIQLARTLRSETTGVLYVLDEPSIGLHPGNVEGLLHVFDRLLMQGNSLVVVDHDTDILRRADWLIEMGKGAGRSGGTVITEGTVREAEDNPDSVMGGYLSGREMLLVRKEDGKMLSKEVRGKEVRSREVRSREVRGKEVPPKKISLHVNHIYTLKDITAAFPVGKLTAVTGMSGSGKSTLILDCLVPAVNAVLQKKPIPAHVDQLELSGIKRVVMVDAAPVGKNTRSAVATYSGILDEIRPLFAALPEAVERGFDAGYFSYNMKTGACPTCGGTGQVSLDIQYLPDMELVCPDCGGKRYTEDVLSLRWNGRSIADVLELTVEDALEVFAGIPSIDSKLDSLNGLGLGYLKLGEATPNLSGGEAQRLKLVSEMGRSQKGTLFVFDEPTTGLHPKDIRKLLGVFGNLMDAGGTIIVIEHDLDVIANADYVVDMGPGGGIHGGRIIADGTPPDICGNHHSLTGKYLRRYANHYGLDW